MLKEIRSCVEHKESFAFETTLSGLAYLHHIQNWRSLGYHVSLFFLSLPSADMAVARVAERVRQGGHDIPEAVIRRRFEAGKKHFEHTYRTAVDAWALFDNKDSEPLLIAWGERT
jgi:predicted ABC-type ATPase